MLGSTNLLGLGLLEHIHVTRASPGNNPGWPSSQRAYLRGAPAHAVLAILAIRTRSGSDDG
jgi:hypothetical protein